MYISEKIGSIGILSMICASLLAQAEIGAVAIWFMFLAGIIAISMLIIKAMGYQIPNIVNQILWVIFCVCIGILAIKIIMIII